MDKFTYKISLIGDIDALNSMKEEFKEKIIDSSLHWKDRMTLYKKVQLINERLQYLGESKK